MHGMLKNAFLIVFATQFALTSTAYCQSPLPMPVEIVHEPATTPQQSVGGNELPFVSGHSPVPHMVRSRYETDGNCNECEQRQTVIYCDEKAQKKANLQHKYWGYPELFCERPHGSLLRSHLDAQIGKGIAGQMILYRYDFFDVDQPHADSLKPAGFRSVSRIVELATLSPTPIMIEGTGDPTRDAARRGTVLNAFSQMSFPIAEEQLVTIDRDPFGVTADEATLNYGRMIQQTQSGGGPGGSSQGSGSSIPVIPLGAFGG